jgi:hypothetical protein
VAPTAAPVVARTVAPTVAPAVVAEDPITVTGVRTMDTRPFDLRGGNYTVTWSATNAETRSGYAHSSDLESVAGGYSGVSAPMMLNVAAGQTQTGETQAYRDYVPPVGGQRCVVLDSVRSTTPLGKPLVWSSFM